METTSPYPPAYEHYHPDMYAMATKASPEIQVQKAYGMTSSLSMDPSMRSIPKEKKDNFLTSIFGALSNIVWEHLGRVPSSFMSNIHNTLSVTVVPNEGIISQDFFKNLTRSCEQLAIEQHNDTSEKSNPKIMDKLSSKSMYDVTSSLSHIFTDRTTNVSLPTKTSLNSEMITNNENKMNVNSNDTKSFDCPINSTEIFNELDVRIASVDTRENKRPDHNDMESKIMEESMNCETISSNFNDSITDDSTEGRTKRKTITSSSSSDTSVLGKNQGERMMGQTRTNGLHAMWRKVVHGVSERFSSPRTVSPDSEVPTKKANLSKPQRRKTCTVARVRGKGRGKSQLRRNGVSQSRHRKERTKQNIYCNIQDDLNAWKDSERYVRMDDDESSINERTIDQQDSFDTTDSAPSSSHHPVTLLDSLPCDVSSIARKRKQSLPTAGAKCVKYIPESSMEIEPHDSSYDIEIECQSRLGEGRPRLISESSVDSEDSYCIVFENGSECSDYDYDDISDEASDVDSDEDSDDDEKTTLTVRFNLEPQVHTMIKWDYAYRAARRGPWEEMARDRERFRGRIKCVERILNPILSVQHRNHIWQKRFDIDEELEQTDFITKTQQS